MKDILNKFTEEIRKVCQDNLKSIILYGSRASGESSQKYSDYNLLLILEDTSPKKLFLLNKPIKKWIKRGNPPPVIFNLNDLKNSLDVFPIEFLEMKENRKVLYGKDLIGELEIKQNFLRHECEFTLKSNLILLQQAYIINYNKPKKLKQIMFSSLSSFLTVFRWIIPLLGKIAPLKKLDALSILEKEIGLDASVFATIYSLKRQERSAKNINLRNLMEKYIIEIEKVSKIIDKLIL